MARATAFRVAIPSWGVGTGGTRFARFPGPGEPRTLLEKLDDCGVVQALVRVTPGISLHIPWDKPRPSGPGDAASIRARLLELGLSIESMNSNTFQDQPGQALSYKFGSLSHTDFAVRRQAIDHNLECLDDRPRAGRQLAHRLDRRRRQLPRPDPLPPLRRSLRRVAAVDPRRAARRLEAVHRAQVLRAGVLLDGPERLGHQLPVRPRGRRPLPVAGRSRASRAERQHRADRRPAHSAARTRRLPLQRQQVRRRRPRQRIDQAVPAVPGLQRAGRRRARGHPGIRPGLHARPVAQRHRSAREPDDQRDGSRARLRPGAPRRSRGAGRGPGQQRRRCGPADPEGGVPDRRLADPRRSARPRGRRHRSGGRLPRQRLPRDRRQGRGPPRAASGSGIV